MGGRCDDKGGGEVEGRERLDVVVLRECGTVERSGSTKL